MPLTDVYCLFNRARQGELVSPDDLLAAARLFPKINPSLSLRQFASGVLVVQSASHSDAQVFPHAPLTRSSPCLCVYLQDLFAAACLVACLSE